MIWNSLSLRVLTCQRLFDVTYHYYHIQKIMMWKIKNKKSVVIVELVHMLYAIFYSFVFVI